MTFVILYLQAGDTHADTTREVCREPRSQPHKTNSDPRRLEILARSSCPEMDVLGLIWLWLMGTKSDIPKVCITWSGAKPHITRKPHFGQDRMNLSQCAARFTAESSL